MAGRKAFEEISSNTQVRDFPDYYNQDIAELVKRIDELSELLEEKEEKINTLKSKFNNALNALRAEYLTKFEELNKKD